MEEYKNIEKRLSAGREDYQRVPVPEEMRERIESSIARAEEEKAKGSIGIADVAENVEKKQSKRRSETKMNQKKKMGLRIAAVAAAAVATLIILPNTGANVAHAMGSLPVVGKLFQAVTFRDYQYASDRFDANVEVPQIVVDDIGEAGTGTDSAEDAGTEQSAGETSNPLQETVEQINFDIEEVTNQLIEEFQASADLGESYGSLEIHHETVTNNDRYFTLKLSLYQGAGSGYESYKFYTIDKKTGKQIQIGDLFREGSNYNELISENIKDQMRAQMAEDENKIYWVDYEDVPDWNWSGLKEDQNFYFDEDGNIVVVFDEYEVAPGYMGASEFTVEREVFQDILK